jgi:hypothetical protein
MWSGDALEDYRVLFTPLKLDGAVEASQGLCRPLELPRLLHAYDIS